ncbi:MAG: hypothetical protein ABI723_10915 [Bacteroidia bacterium]
MRIIITKFFLVLNFSFIIFNSCFSQGDANALIKAVNEKFKSVQDYTADVQIKTDISFVKMFPVNALIYFKQPDKIHFKSKGIAILPKQGPQFFLNEIDDKNYMAIYSGEQMYNGVLCKGVKVIPLQDTADLILATFFIEPQKLLIHHTQVTTKSRGTVTMDFRYGKYETWLLPDMLTFEMDVNKFKIPKAVAADLENTSTKKEDDKKSKKGRVIITYKSYVINSGLKDELFK